MTIKRTFPLALKLSHAVTIVKARPCHSAATGLGKNSAMRGEPNPAMLFNTKRCREDRVTKNKVAEKYMGTVARCHGGDKVVERGRVAKKKLRWRRRESKKNRTRVNIGFQ